MKDLFPDRDTLASQIARYNRELLKTSQRSAFPTENTAAVAAETTPAEPLRQTPLMDSPREARQEETESLSDFPTDPPAPADSLPYKTPTAPDAPLTPPPSARETTREAPRTSFPLTEDNTPVPPPHISEEGVSPPPPPTDYPRDSIGYLQVQVFTAREASPLQGAHIAVYETVEDGTQHLVTAATSDNSGFSPMFALPSVSSELSQQPGSPRPYVPYAVTVNYPGYYRVRNESIPVFAGIISRQPIFLTPLPEMGADDNFEIVYSEYKPDELN